MHRWIKSFLLLVTPALLALGCGGSEDADTETIANAGSEVRAGGDRVATGATGSETGDVAGMDGSALYQTHCAGCHGIDGNGGAVSKVISGEDNIDSILEQMINGGGGMPSFATLSDEGLLAIAEFVSSDL